MTIRDATLASLCNQPVRYLRRTATGTDAHNNTTYEWVPDAETTDVYLEQTQPFEVVIGQDVQYADWRLVDPDPDAGLTGRDRVEANGTEFEVVGPPATPHDEFGPHHLEARLRASA